MRAWKVLLLAPLMAMLSPHAPGTVGTQEAVLGRVTLAALTARSISAPLAGTSTTAVSWPAVPAQAEGAIPLHQLATKYTWPPCSGRGRLHARAPGGRRGRGGLVPLRSEHRGRGPAQSACSSWPGTCRPWRGERRVGATVGPELLGAPARWTYVLPGPAAWSSSRRWSVAGRAAPAVTTRAARHPLPMDSSAPLFQLQRARPPWHAAARRWPTCSFRPTSSAASPLHYAKFSTSMAAPPLPTASRPPGAFQVGHLSPRPRRAFTSFPGAAGPKRPRFGPPSHLDVLFSPRWLPVSLRPVYAGARGHRAAPPP